ncbi:MarR family winged helix-turn-helix transcriptional regulator [Pseudolysinimonas sp.]|uniref:MarR family winged helix-turn-helix transcriptional regulator n=1 Tax=Pseudolysinimonas sp. TaxID=2680009 RepID=UPI003F819BBC
MAQPADLGDDPLAAWPTGRLLATAARATENRWHAALDGLGLTHAGLVALHLLDGGPLAQADLARAARVEAQTMSRTLERLERAGYVSREPHPTDRRRILVARTPEGDAALARAQVVERDLFPSAADTAAFRGALLEIIRAGGAPQ